ncbi:hypothetical protein BC941DRAFT_477521, partial [Chlamydoabsidia padenii]
DQIVEEAVRQEKPVVIEELLSPDEDEEIVEDAAADIADAGAAFDVDPDKMFDVDISEGEEANEEEKLIFKENNQDALMPSSNSGGQNQVTRSRYEDSDHDIDLDIRGRTSSLGGGVVRSWPHDKAGIPMVVPSLGKRSVKRRADPRKRQSTIT